MKMGVTREDVAKLAGVSGTTVSYVLNNTKQVTPEVRQRVWDAAKQLNYHPSLLARGLATRETKHIAIIVKNLQNPYYTAIQEGIQTIAAREGYIVSVLSAHESPVADMNILLSRGIDGVIIASSSAGGFKELLRPNAPMAVVSEEQSVTFYRNAVFSHGGGVQTAWTPQNCLFERSANAESHPLPLSEFPGCPAGIRHGNGSGAVY